MGFVLLSSVYAEGLYSTGITAPCSGTQGSAGHTVGTAPQGALHDGRAPRT